MTNSRKIVGIGETVLDIVFRCGQPKAAVPGGSTFNAMISLGRTAGKHFPEIPLYMISQLGDDEVSKIVTSFMAENNVRSEFVKRIPGTQSTVSMALLDENNDARYEFFRDRSAPEFKAEDIEFSEGDILIFGSFFAISPATRQGTWEIVQKAKDSGAIIYYDINFRKNHQATLPQTKQFIERNCSASDVVRGSSEDIEAIYGSSDAQKVYRENMSSLCKTFICTRGGDSAKVFSEGVSAEFPVPRISDVVSTIGAGDNFNAGFVYGLVRNGFTKERVNQLSMEDWKSLVPTAAGFSANVCRSMDNYVDLDFADSL